MKTYKYRLYPSKSQAKILNKNLSACRRTYNKCLEYKKVSYEADKTQVTEFDLNKKICEWRNGEEPWMQNAGVAILHDVSRRVCRAYGGFFRRIQKGEKPGFPRFKGKHRYDSFTVPRFTFKTRDHNESYKKIRLTNELGWVKIKLHREISGKPVNYTIHKNRCGEWFISICCETKKVSVQHDFSKSKNVGLDMGCTKFITTSSGDEVANPRFLKEESENLTKASRKKNWKAVAKIHKRISNKRLDFHHKLSNKLVQENDIIFAEALNVQKMSQNSWKNVRKSMIDAGWSQFLTILSYKAEDAGKIFKVVNPAYTTQTCNSCKSIKKLSLSNRKYECECGYVEDRDVNAAKNILTLGLQSLKNSPSG